MNYLINIKKSILYMIIIMWMNEPIIQLQYLLFGKKIISFSPYSIGIPIILILWISKILIHRRNDLTINKEIFPIYLIYIYTSILILIINILKGYLPINYYLYSYRTLFYFVIILLFTLVYNKDKFYNKRDLEKGFIKFISIIAIVLMIFGFVQYIYNDPIVPIVDENNNELVQVWNFYGNMRIFSLFQFPGNYGYFICFVVNIWIIKFIDTKNKFLKLILIILIILGIITVYLTKVRTSILLMALSFIGIILIKRRISPRQILFSSICISIITFSTYYSLSGEHKTLFSGEIFNNGTLLQRFKIWDYMLKQYVFNGNLLDMMFGNSIITSAKYGLDTPIDNFYVSIILYSGVVGLVIWCVLNIKISKYIHNNARHNNSAIWQVASAMFFAFPTVFILATIPDIPYIIFIISMVVSKNNLVVKNYRSE